MDFLLFFLAFFFLSRGGRGNLSMLRKILKPHIKACFIAKLYQTTLFFNKFFKKKKAQVNKHNPPNSNHLRGSKIQGLTPGSLNSLFVLGFSFLPVTQEDRFKSDLPVFTQQVGITGSFTKRRAAHSFAPQFPLSSLPTAAQMDAPAQHKEPNAFPPSQSCREAMAELCWLTPDLHPCSPPALLGSVPGSRSLILSAAVQEVVNHRSAPGQGCLLPTEFTPCAGSALPVTCKGSAWGQPRHPKSSCRRCLL